MNPADARPLRKPTSVPGWLAAACCCWRRRDRRGGRRSSYQVCARAAASTGRAPAGGNDGARACGWGAWLLRPKRRSAGYLRLLRCERLSARVALVVHAFRYSAPRPPATPTCVCAFSGSCCLVRWVSLSKVGHPGRCRSIWTGTQLCWTLSGAAAAAAPKAAATATLAAAMRATCEHLPVAVACTPLCRQHVPASAGNEASSRHAVRWWHAHRMLLPAACWRLCGEMRCRDGKGADNSSPETTTDDSDPLDWTGSDKDNVQVLCAAVFLAVTTRTPRMSSSMLLPPSGVAEAGSSSASPKQEQAAVYCHCHCHCKHVTDACGYC